MHATLLLLAVLCQAAPATSSDARAYVVRIEVGAEQVDRPFYPMSIEIDGAALLKPAGAKKRFDSASLRLWRVRNNGRRDQIPCNA
jgi:hypothetical protein